ncbi:hypothetical protein MTR67_014950 [Solanum verrucosum]|uniref:Uncharacterized protein n=1 Tax=Solanum verrucosum TaxID=315347 RepID=A0AAF0TQ53_SOLVR|nr:hypothetical protein MTR67_014950 [Solanum verrucosum]
MSAGMRVRLGTNNGS